MKCRSCDLEIAEKAIVCYRCGAPTAVAAPERPALSRPGPGRGNAVIVLLIAVLAAWFVPMAIHGTGGRWAAWVAVIVAAAVTLRWFAGRARSGPRR
jgi:hypothetical protein